MGVGHVGNIPTFLFAGGLRGYFLPPGSSGVTESGVSSAHLAEFTSVVLAADLVALGYHRQ